MDKMILPCDDIGNEPLRVPDIFMNLDLSAFINGNSQTFEFKTKDIENLDDPDIPDDRNAEDSYYEGSSTVESQLINKSFQDLSEEMEDLGGTGLIKKKILKEGRKGMFVDNNSIILLNYDIYIDGNPTPVDCERAYMRTPLSFVTGLEAAVSSMQYQEKSQFLISWKCAFGKFGATPNIPPEADILAIIEILEKPPSIAGLTIPTGVIDEYVEQRHRIKNLQNEGKIAFQKDPKLSLLKYKEGLNTIKSLSTKSEEQKTELQQLTIIFNLNLAVVYNRLKNAQKALQCCNNVLELDANNRKAIFHRGRAYLQMNDLAKAANELLKGKNLFPDNEEFEKELWKLEDKRTLGITNELAKVIIK